ncbi:MAG: IS30 family transposase, partial [Coriobacteriaceae bacterium]|nr:IS30 family transposase [Coriobacteriaceae bacterium]
KGRGIAFDDLHTRDLAILMSHLNSQPRASLAMSTPISLLKGALKEEADVLLDALGIEEVAYDVLDMTVEAINRERRKRGDKPLI